MRLTALFALSLVALASKSHLARAQVSEDAERQEKVARLIEQLDADRYDVREQASRQLGDIGLPALAALRQAGKHPSTEVRRRAAAIVEALTVGVQQRELIAFCSQSDERLDMEQGMWLIARIIDPNAERAPITKQLDELADKVRRRLGKDVDPAAADPQAAVEALRKVLFVEYGFDGNPNDYYNPDNSAIHRVLATRKGLPILLSHVTIAVARRLKIPIAGVPVSPYIVKYDGSRAPNGIPAEDIYFHPHEQGRLLSRADRATAFPGENPDRMEPEGTRREILCRMLRNLVTAYENRGAIDKRDDAERMLAMLEAFEPPANP